MEDETPTESSPEDEASSSPEPPPAAASHGRRKWLLGVLTLVFLLCGGAYGTYWALIGRFEESTDDAYVAGNVVPLTTRVNGTVITIRADNTQRVQEGQPLVLLDSTDARIGLEQLEARLAQTVRQVQGLYQTEAQQEANVALQKARLAQSMSDYRRDLNLVHQKYVSAQDYQHSGTQVDVDRASLEVAEHQFAATRAAVANTGLADHPEVRLAAANLRDAYVALQRTTIRAPVSGYVDKRSVQVGDRVSPGMPLMAIIPLNQIWVDANFKESQLRNVRTGQPVSLTSDLYGGSVVYHGRVIGLGAGTGSAFAVLPPQNATGNWIKVVQRVPVRIGLDPKEVDAHPLRIGLSMEAVIDTHDRSGAVLRADPKSRDVYVTHVYQDEDKGAAALISRIIQQNTVMALPTKVTAPAASGTPAAEGIHSIHSGRAKSTRRMTAGLPRSTQVDPPSHD
jgi:membrane fusion protein (multidrug efflux system)